MVEFFIARDGGWAKESWHCVAVSFSWMKKEGGSSSTVPGFMYSVYHVTLIHPIEPSIYPIPFSISHRSLQCQVQMSTSQNLLTSAFSISSIYGGSPSVYYQHSFRYVLINLDLDSNSTILPISISPVSKTGKGTYMFHSLLSLLDSIYKMIAIQYEYSYVHRRPEVTVLYNVGLQFA
jgi:hypothetical protein